ncbi:MAG TPA: hypothetical protein ENN53_01190 [Candidatus Acetothermia bacterium]|nr:hypothetical protein [Candidatus Acetothermia bacterium]
MRVLVLYDNVAHPPLHEGWGFCALVEVGERRILFDTGADRLLLAHNAQALGVNLAQLTDVFLSVLVSGCAHPGVERMADRASELTGAGLHLVLGGFHLGRAPSHRIREVAARLGQTTQGVAPGHCTGEEATASLLVRFPGSEALAVGKEFRI